MTKSRIGNIITQNSVNFIEITEVLSKQGKVECIAF